MRINAKTGEFVLFDARGRNVTYSAQLSQKGQLLTPRVEDTLPAVISNPSDRQVFATKSAESALMVQIEERVDKNDTCAVAFPSTDAMG